MILTVLLYALECRVLTKGQLTRLEHFQMMSLRRIIKQPAHISRLSNETLQKRHGISSIESNLQVKRLKLWKTIINIEGNIGVHAAMFGKFPWDSEQPDVHTSKILHQLRDDTDAFAAVSGHSTEAWGGACTMVRYRG